MRAIFGVVALLIVFAIVGFLAGKQLRSLRPVPTVSGAASAPVAAGRASAGGQAQQLQQKLRDDVANALERGAQNNARGEEAGK